jgi:ubiquinone/menaquinone biosynthesis C-methylase UbiE
LNNYYDWIADIYDRTRPLPSSVSEQVADCILSLVGAKAETIFLEPGIGTGRTALPIIKRGYAYTGVDISKEMMDQLHYKLQGVPNQLTLIQANAASLPFQNDSFDVVLTTHVLHCLPDWLKGLAEIRRVLKPTGVYLACENLLTEHQKEFENSFKAILSQYQPKVQKTVEENIRLTPFGKEMIQVLAEQGATVETITAARWRVEQTVGELLEIYQSKAIGICWSVPDDIFSEAMQDFRAWCQKHYGSEDVVLSSDATFDITVARNWAFT